MTEFLNYIAEVKNNASATAFYKLVQLFEHKVFTLCYRIIGNREEAEEAAQDVFMNCYKNLHKIEDPSKFPQWLLKIAYSKSIDYVRKKKIPKLSLDEIRQISGDVNKTNSKGDLSRSEVLETALKTLTPADSALIYLFYQEDMSVKEIADFTDLSESNVKVRLHRTRAEIRKILESRIVVKPKDQG